MAFFVVLITTPKHSYSAADDSGRPYAFANVESAERYVEAYLGERRRHLPGECVCAEILLQA